MKIVVELDLDDGVPTCVVRYGDESRVARVMAWALQLKRGELLGLNMKLHVPSAKELAEEAANELYGASLAKIQSEVPRCS